MKIRDGDVEVTAEAIYETHRKSPAPSWANASTEVKDWVRAQAVSAIEVMIPRRQRAEGSPR
jgi:hypothetical protein